MPARYIFLLTFCVKFSSGRVREDPAAAAPQRRRGHAGARAAGALLAPRLLGRVLDLAAVLLRARALARVGLVGDDDLVHQRFVVVAAEHGVGRVDLRGRLALVVEELEFHQFGSLLGGALAGLDGRAHDHVAVLRARHRAAHQQQLARFVDAHDVEVLRGARSRRRSWPDIRLPGNTRPGSCAIEIEPGTLCERLLPCDARFELKLWRLIVPAKPLPIEVPCTSTFWPTANMSTGTVRARLELGGDVGGDAEFASASRRPRRPPWRGGRLRAWSRARRCARRTRPGRRCSRRSLRS